MSAPPLSEAGSTSVGASFYNSMDTTFYPYEATPEAAQRMAPPRDNDTTPGPGQSVLSDTGFVVAADVDSNPASYIGEDGRLTLLRGKACGSSTLNPANPREIDTIFQDMATNSSGSRATISQETLRLLPIVSQTVIQFVGELQANNSQLHMSNPLSRGSLNANMNLQLQIDHLRQDIRKTEAQEASLKAELERLGIRAVLDHGVESSSKKRRQA
ncbi:uncharacterized protein RAG0_14771 [Rhynchosporium agropyri]|uniref:Uncharacterized protein n=1 Tax=Rhynchosporium agropyri TaxID=914238 RepID=A0A1E1LI89_9HELO|nr:uncharacterized protein RAG0_14771 [Rhynchosporium agropyri]